MSAEGSSGVGAVAEDAGVRGSGDGRGSGRWLDAAEALDRWMADRDYAGHDPHDLLASPLVRALTLGSRWLAVGWTQLGKRSPIDARQLLGVPRRRNAKGMALVLSSHLRLARAAGDDRYRRSALELVEWLESAGAATPSGVGWGYPFPWANRDFYAPTGTPSSVATSFVVHALLDAAERLGSERARTLAERGGAFLRCDLNRVDGDAGRFCFSYTPLDRRAVHNASLLTASVLARLAAAARDGDALREDALAAARFSVVAQSDDGAWPYGVGRRNAWVDSFHTSYNLVALARIGRHLGTDEFDASVDRGVDYWLRTFVRGDGVRFHAGSAYPVDMHAVAHTILALLELRGRIPGAESRAVSLARWSLDEMRSSDGRFYYEKRRLYTNRIAYMRWTQSWMLRALAELAEVTAGRGGVAR